MRTYEISFMDNHKYNAIPGVRKTTIVAHDALQALAIFHQNYKKVSPIDVKCISKEK